jgi:feruloyl esterase
MPRNGTAFTVLGIATLMASASKPASAQAFADLKIALVNYSQSDLEPHKACDAMGKFKSKDIAQINAMMIPAAAPVPAHCRVTGLLSPEIAFEVSLPAKWNGRFYMIGNGGLAGESMEDPAAWLNGTECCSSDSPLHRRTQATMRVKNPAAPSF